MQNPDKPKHYCGVFGVFNDPNAAELTYYGLRALQHRGQESAGIVSSDGTDKRFEIHKGMGLVTNVFAEADLVRLQGIHAIGHNRYSTTGSSERRNAQPFDGILMGGEQVALGHNGNLTNTSELKAELDDVLFRSTTDSEVILHLLARAKGESLGDALAKTVRRLEGAYALVLLTKNALVGVRDPHGYRPLSIGRKGGAWFFASETCAFDLVGAEFVRDVEPGEIVIAEERGLTCIQAFPLHTARARCIFEMVYFARPDSNVWEQNVHMARQRMGRQLALEYPLEADIVTPIPDSGLSAAIGYAHESGIPLDYAFMRNHYTGRSFIEPQQLFRELSARVKLNLIPEVVRGKRVIVIDDSIVRGTTGQKRMNAIKEAGAREVHLLISCPPHTYPCRYGIDFPDRSKLIAATHSFEEIKRFLDVDTLGYLSLDGMLRATGLPTDSFCTACFTGNYAGPPKLEQFATA